MTIGCDYSTKGIWLVRRRDWAASKPILRDKIVVRPDLRALIDDLTDYFDSAFGNTLWIERPVMIQNGETTMAMARVAALVEFAAVSVGVPVHYVNVSSWRKAVLRRAGRGLTRDAAKKLALEWIHNNGAPEERDHNFADAACISYYGWLQEEKVARTS